MRPQQQDDKKRMTNVKQNMSVAGTRSGCAMMVAKIVAVPADMLWASSFTGGSIALYAEVAVAAAAAQRARMSDATTEAIATAAAAA